MLAHRAIQYPFTHDILLLIELLRANSIDGPENAEDLVLLTPFAAAWRYDDPLQESTGFEVGWLLERGSLLSHIRRCEIDSYPFERKQEIGVCDRCADSLPTFLHRPLLTIDEGARWLWRASPAHQSQTKPRTPSDARGWSVTPVVSSPGH